MGTFAITDNGDLLNAVNYAISNLGSTTAAIAGNILTVNTDTNAVTVGVGGQIYSYNVPYINIRYANNATGTNGFTPSPTNSFYYGIQASSDSNPATIDNPASYAWNQVAGTGFGTTNYLFYQTPGGRQITFSIDTAAPTTSYLQTQDGVAINIDFVSTIAANVVTANTIANGAITGSQIAANTITGYNIQTNTINDVNIAPNTLTGSKIATNTITGTNIATFTITAGKIANATITSTQIASNTITGTNLLNATITGSKIGTNTVTGTNIGVQTITANNIANATITGQQLATNIAISTTGNITAAYHIGNGSLLTNISGNSVGSVAQANYANIANSVAGGNVTGQVANALIAGTVYTAAQPNITSVGTLTVVNTSGNISAVGNISGNYFLGNGRQLTGLPVQPGTYSNANVAAYLPTYSGTILVDQVNFTNNSGVIEQGAERITITGNAIQVNTGGYFNDGGEATIFANGPVILVTNTTGNINPQWTFDQLGDLSAPGNISAVGQITSNNFIVNPVALANLTAISGARAFVNNANLIAANNFGQQISGGGSNIVPVWSDGTNWFIG